MDDLLYKAFENAKAYFGEEISFIPVDFSTPGYELTRKVDGEVIDYYESIEDFIAYWE